MGTQRGAHGVSVSPRNPEPAQGGQARWRSPAAPRIFRGHWPRALGCDPASRRETHRPPHRQRGHWVPGGIPRGLSRETHPQRPPGLAGIGFRGSETPPRRGVPPHPRMGSGEGGLHVRRLGAGDRCCPGATVGSAGQHLCSQCPTGVPGKARPLAGSPALCPAACEGPCQAWACGAGVRLPGGPCPWVPSRSCLGAVGTSSPCELVPCPARAA